MVVTPRSVFKKNAVLCLMSSFCTCVCVPISLVKVGLDLGLYMGADFTNSQLLESVLRQHTHVNGDLIKKQGHTNLKQGPITQICNVSSL